MSVPDYYGLIQDSFSQGINQAAGLQKVSSDRQEQQLKLKNQQELNMLNQEIAQNPNADLGVLAKKYPNQLAHIMDLHKLKQTVTDEKHQEAIAAFTPLYSDIISGNNKAISSYATKHPDFIDAITQGQMSPSEFVQLATNPETKEQAQGMVAAGLHMAGLDVGKLHKDINADKPTAQTPNQIAVNKINQGKLDEQVAQNKWKRENPNQVGNHTPASVLEYEYGLNHPDFRSPASLEQEKINNYVPDRLAVSKGRNIDRTFNRILSDKSAPAYLRKLASQWAGLPKALQNKKSYLGQLDGEQKDLPIKMARNTATLQQLYRSKNILQDTLDTGVTGQNLKEAQWLSSFAGYLGLPPSKLADLKVGLDTGSEDIVRNIGAGLKNFREVQWKSVLRSLDGEGNLNGAKIALNGAITLIKNNLKGQKIQAQSADAGFIDSPMFQSLPEYTRTKNAIDKEEQDITNQDAESKPKYQEGDTAISQTV